MAKKYRLYEECTNEKHVREIVDMLRRDYIMIYPTDTAYALGCALSSIKAINQIKRLKNKKDDNLSLICCNMSSASDYAKVDNATFRILKENTPSPVTFILNASNTIPNSFLDKKKSVGIRIPQCNIARVIVEELGEPLVSTTIPLTESEEEYSNPSLIYDEWGDRVDIFVDGGDIWGELSTVCSLVDGDISILRDGDYKLKL